MFPQIIMIEIVKSYKVHAFNGPMCPIVIIIEIVVL